MKYIDNVKDLDTEIKRVDERFMISDDEGRQALSEFCYAVQRNLPEDPYSKEYYDAQMKLYLELSGRNHYSIDNEHSPFNFEAVKNNPFPYLTKSPATVGDQLIAQGFLIQKLNLGANSRIVEFGPGWGNTTLHLAQMDYKVTAVDVEPSFIDLIRYRTEMFSKKVDLVNKDMLEFTSDEKYDAALFFESFHHCSNHLKLLANLNSLINENGIIAFAAEPIADFPYPWGVRLDGISVWSIRKFGWLELGFDTTYFLKTLLSLGWTPRRYRSDASPIADVIVARKSNMYYEPSEMTLPPDECKTWAPKETDPNVKLRFTQAASVMTCKKDVNVKFVELCVGNYAPFDLNVRLSAGSVSTTFRVPKQMGKDIYRIPIQDWNGKIVITSKTWQPSRFLHNSDERELGVAVHYVRLID